MSFQGIPKADMHVHLEGTITPAMVRHIAKRNGLQVPQGLFDTSGERFFWADDDTAAAALKNFVQAYDVATSVMKTAQDYTDITYDYLSRSAAEKCIYAEIIISADHGAMAGLAYAEMLAAIEKGYIRARNETGIEMRLISTCVRHYGADAALRVAQITRDNPHPLVTGFGMAGDENAGRTKDFAAAYDLCGLSFRNAHAGEAAGPESVRQARDILHVRRFGHMVRAIEDKDLMQELAAQKAVPEVCVSSNLVLKVYADYKSHPLRRFFDMGLPVVLGSDDPTFFQTSIGREYQIAQEEFGFSDAELLQITRNAIDCSFADDELRQKLQARLSF
jgi:adenosine deaminase